MEKLKEVLNIVYIIYLSFNDQLSLLLEITPTDNSILDTISVFGPEFYVSFDLKINSFPSDWAGVIQFGGDSGNLIRMYAHPSSRIRIDYTTNQWVEYGFDQSNLNSGTYYRLEILQSLILDKVCLFN